MTASLLYKFPTPSETIGRVSFLWDSGHVDQKCPRCSFRASFTWEALGARAASFTSSRRVGMLEQQLVSFSPRTHHESTYLPPSFPMLNDFF